MKLSTIQTWCRSFCASLPMRVALAGVTAVWGVGCVWSFAEQRAFAAAKHFTIPELLPLGLDGFAAAMAGVAYAASLDGRPAVGARLGTATAVALSAGSNGVWASQRSNIDPATIALAVVVPVIANIAFEVLLGEMRRRVQRRRGLPAPIAVPMPRVIRLVLAPRSTFASWRRHVLDVTDPGRDASAGPRVMLARPLDGGDPLAERASVSDESPRPASVPMPVPGRPAVREVVDDGHWCIDAGPVARVVPGRPDRDDDTQPLELPESSEQVTERAGRDDGAQHSGRPGDAEIVAALVKRSPLPGIGTIRAEFKVGAGRAGRLQKEAERVAARAG